MKKFLGHGGPMGPKMKNWYSFTRERSDLNPAKYQCFIQNANKGHIQDVNSISNNLF